VLAIVDYGAGNLRSVVNAVEALGRAAKLVDKPGDLREATAFILPGVGAFGDGMDGLRKRDLVEALGEEVVVRRKPYLGICLGLQFLADESEENGRHAGLGWLGGMVRRIVPAEASYKVPHIGWNDLAVRHRGVLLEGVDEPPVFYFVHGYYLDPESGVADAVTSTCWHGAHLTATVERDNIFGVQFHPEKSQQAGLKVIENFLRAAGL
jgi:glutamine amidotransferase